MLTAKDLKEYRSRRGFSQRDVSMYCDVSYRMIGLIESGERNLTEETYQEIVKGINAASQAKVRGTFDEDKKKFNEEENAYENNRQKEKRATEKKSTPTKRKSTKPTSSKTVKAEK